MLYIYSASLLRKDPKGLSGLRAALGTQSVHMHRHWVIHNPPSVNRRTARVQFTSYPNGSHPCRFVCAWIVPPRILWESLLSPLTLRAEQNKSTSYIRVPSCALVTYGIASYDQPFNPTQLSTARNSPSCSSAVGRDWHQHRLSVRYQHI